MRIILTMLFLLAVSTGRVISQDMCGTDEVHAYMMNTNLQYRQQYYSTQEQIRAIIESGTADRGDVLYEIPVVVHVIHLGEPVGQGSNISDAQIIGAINGLNERYANLNGIGVDIQMTFCLAKTDPFGCPTNGIVRVDGSGVPNYSDGGVTRDVDKSGCSNAASDESVKDLSHWPVNNYYNIWVVHTICGGWAGYAYYPWGSIYDGAIMHRSYMTYNSTTLAHEIGHAFNLPHTFDGDNSGQSCPPNDFCASQGDQVCDTPPHKVSDCGATNPCSSEGIWDNSRRNYMSYCGSTNRFTQGQKERMHASLQVFPRNQLLNSTACSSGNFGSTANVANVSCIGSCDGSITIQHSCEGNFTYLWNNGSTTAGIQNLCPGNYMVTIYDSLSMADHVLSFVIAEGLSVDTTSMITASGSLSLCEGESVTLSVSPAGVYQWSNGENTASIVVTESGSYDVEVLTAMGCVFHSQAVEVVVHDLPQVSLDLPEVVDYMDTPFSLNFGVPAGGVYEGPGVSEGMFYPALAGAGIHVVSYEFTDSNGCSTRVEDTIQVVSSMGITSVSQSNEFIVYPNPSHGELFVKMNRPQDAMLFGYDAAGMLIFTHAFAEADRTLNTPINLPAVASGIYFIKIVTDQNEFVYPIVVRFGAK